MEYMALVEHSDVNDPGRPPVGRWQGRWQGGSPRCSASPLSGGGLVMRTQVESKGVNVWIVGGDSGGLVCTGDRKCLSPPPVSGWFF